MISLVVLPHVGIGPLRLGASRTAIREAAGAAGLGPGTSHAEADYFAGDTLQVDYDEDAGARFIAVSAGEGHRAVYAGVEVFATEAREVFRLAAEADRSGLHAFDPEGFLFPNQILTLWAAEPPEGAGPELVWGQIGIGTPAYRAAVERIRARDT